MGRLLAKYAEYPVKVLIADPDAVGFYEKSGFVADQGCRAMFLKKPQPPAAS